MALSRSVKEQLAVAGIPEESEIRQMVLRFLIRSGYTLFDLSEAIGYSRVAVSHFMNGQYDRHHRRDTNTLMLRATLKDFVESHPIAAQEREDGQLYKTEDYRRIRRAFQNALQHGWAYCVDGAPGTRKTFLLKALVRELMEGEVEKNGNGRRAFYVRARIRIGPFSLLQRIAIAAGVPERGSIDQVIKKILFHFQNRRAVLVIDEAQLLDVACLETVRELLDEPPFFGLIFAGSHDVERRFNNLQMEQWRSRVQKTIHLEGIAREDAEQMVAAELGALPAKAVNELIETSYVSDIRTGSGGATPRRYLSARNLFWTMQQFKALKAEKGATA